MSKKEDKKEKKKKLSFKRTVSNNLFALKIIWKNAPFYMTVYLISSIIYGILDFLVGSFMLRLIVDSISEKNEVSRIITIVAGLGLINITFNFFMQWFWNVLSPRYTNRIAAHVEKMLFKKAGEVELACYETPDFYDKYVKAMDEAYTRVTKVMRSLNLLIQRIVALFSNSLLLFFIDPVLIIFGVFPLLLGIFRRKSNVLSHKISTEQKPLNRRAEYVRRTFYLGEYAKEMRLGNMYKNMLRDLAATYTDFKAIVKKYRVKRALYEYFQHIGLEVITILGAMLYSTYSAMCVGVDNGGMSIGDCVVVLNSIGMISYCLNSLVQNVSEFGEHGLFLEDVRFFLDYEPAIKWGELTVPSEGGVLSVNNVSFRYSGSEEDTLKNVSFSLNKGERIALVGSNGSGKTTLVKLLMRFYDPTGGDISLDGRPLKEYDGESFRKSFGTVFQDFKLFSMSVKNNVLLRKSTENEDEKVVSALKNSGIYDKVNGFEKGIDTVLTREFDDLGENMSVGEQQKIALARVFVSDAPFVILDEPSSALDPIAEYKMFENMMKATEGKSVIFISHRLSAAVLSDRVILMENGSIAECGTHAELMAQNGKYASMFKKQAESYLGSEVVSHG